MPQLSAYLVKQPHANLRADRYVWRTLQRLDDAVGTMDEEALERSLDERATAGQRALLAVTLVHEQMRNGGLHQCWFNRSGRFFRRAIAGLRRLGLVELAASLHDALSWPLASALVPDTLARQQALEPAALTDVQWSAIEGVNEAYFTRVDRGLDQPDAVYVAAKRYIRAHPEAFFDGDATARYGRAGRLARAADGVAVVQALDHLFHLRHRLPADTEVVARRVPLLLATGQAEEALLECLAARVLGEDTQRGSWPGWLESATGQCRDRAQWRPAQQIWLGLWLNRLRADGLGGVAEGLERLALSHVGHEEGLSLLELKVRRVLGLLPRAELEALAPRLQSPQEQSWCAQALRRAGAKELFRQQIRRLREHGQLLEPELAAAWIVETRSPREALAALAQDPRAESKPFLFQRGVLLDQMGERKGSAAAYREALELPRAPGDRSIDGVLWFNLACELGITGQHDATLDAVRQMLAVAPHRARGPLTDDYLRPVWSAELDELVRPHLWPGLRVVADDEQAREPRDWSQWDHAYGAAADLPELLQRLQAPDAELALDALDDIAARVCHQGSVYPATLPALAALLELVGPVQAAPVVPRGPTLTLVAQCVQFIADRSAPAEQREALGPLLAPHAQRLQSFLESPAAGERVGACALLASILRDRRQVTNRIGRLTVRDPDLLVRTVALQSLCERPVNEETFGARCLEIARQATDPLEVWTARRMASFVTPPGGAVADELVQGLAADLTRAPQLRPLFWASPFSRNWLGRLSGPLAETAHALARLLPADDPRVPGWICDALPVADAYEAVLLADLLLKRLLVQPLTERGALAALTSSQRDALRALVSAQDAWLAVSNMYDVLRRWGLPDSRAELGRALGLDDVAGPPFVATVGNCGTCALVTFGGSEQQQRELRGRMQRLLHSGGAVQAQIALLFLTAGWARRADHPLDAEEERIVQALASNPAAWVVGRGARRALLERGLPGTRSQLVRWCERHLRGGQGT